MILDFNPNSRTYFLRIPRKGNAQLIQSLVKEHGLDISTSASTKGETVLIARNKYAAVTFFESATDRAKDALVSLQEEIDLSQRGTSGSHFWVPPGHELWDFQKSDLDYLLSRKHGLDADQPGLGKTPTAICYANEIGAKHVLAIVPANIRLQWERRVREWWRPSWDDLRVCVHCCTNARRGIVPVNDYPATWTIVSYDLARTPAIGRAIARQRYDLVILDEAHFLKTVDSKRTQAIFGGAREPLFPPLAQRAEHILALTGTPLPNRPREAFVLAKNLCYDSIDWMPETEFTERFNPSVSYAGEREDGTIYKFTDERTGRHSELQNRLRANFMVRHDKRKVLGSLRLPIYDLIQVEETTAIKQALQAEHLLDIDPEDLSGADAEVLGHVAVVRRQMGVAMAPQVVEYVKMLLDGGEEKLVLFAWHIEVLDIIEKGLHKYGFLRIDGRTSPTQKEQRVRQFVTDPAHRVIGGNILSMGIGTDGLQEVATHGLIVEPDWTPGNNIQCGDRLYRGGQTGQVQLDIFVASGSIAERVLASALRKLKTTDKALDAKFQLETVK
jgi:SWI/SNF-related matrix-associated actin-dependent regulator of chromatin subfamily A-like protein 1